MPTYVYRRADGTTFEIQQRITAEALTRCPSTGQPVRRVITGGTGLIFKGSGFYQTDYAAKPQERPENGAKEKKEKAEPEPAKAKAAEVESA